MVPISDLDERPYIIKQDDPRFIPRELPGSQHVPLRCERYHRVVDFTLDDHQLDHASGLSGRGVRHVYALESFQG
jgi:hypothetical protein